MTDRKITLETAAFLDSDEAGVLSVRRSVTRDIVQRFLASCYDGVGKAPHLLDAEDLHQILAVHLPGHFGRRDPLASSVEAVLAAYLEHLTASTLVPHAFELQQALGPALPVFQEAVERGAAGDVSHPPPAPIHNRGSKVGRNDPCPCGSGKKFKKCCARLGESS